MSRYGRKIVPVVGGVTAVATAVGAFAPATQVAVAAPDNVDGAVGPLGVAQEGVFESCAAYFGNGKGMVGFDVADVNGSDGVAHAVPDDVDVVLVLENEAGDTIECIPEEWTEEDWDDLVDETFDAGGPALPASPVRYRYPTAEDEPIERDDFGEVTSASFRVVGVPGEHTLVSPAGVQPLADPYPGFDELFDADADPRVVELLTDTAGPDAAAAFVEALADCEAYGPIDEDLTAAFDAILAYIGWDDELELDPCDVEPIEGLAAYGVALVEASDYIEPIRLSVPTPAAPPAPPAAQPTVVAPRYTG